MPSISPFLTLLAATTSTINKTAPTFDLPQSLQQSWATYSPYFPVATYVAPPAGCDIVQVDLLQRHGARYPTSGEGADIEESVAKIKNATSFNSPTLQFVKDYNYTLDNNGYLVLFGAQQSFDAGQEHYVRYANLVSEQMLPFVRASGDERVEESALNWTAGFAYASQDTVVPMLNVILSESGNDTLNNYCPAANSSSPETDEWTDTFTPPILDWINAAAPGANLTGSNVVDLMALCAFDTVTYETPSQWCDVFSAPDFAGYEYYMDVKDYYGNGYGNELGPVQGVGYINELIARLTDTPVQDETQTNHTLDSNPATFPLNRTFYADFTHDDQMISIFSAMGLFAQPAPLDTTLPNPFRTWVVSLMVPFSGRMITEKLSCNADGLQGDYLRILVNDAVQPLPFCGGDADGLCSVEGFVESQSFARNNGDGLWAECLA